MGTGGYVFVDPLDEPDDVVVGIVLWRGVGRHLLCVSIERVTHRPGGRQLLTVLSLSLSLSFVCVSALTVQGILNTNGMMAMATITHHSMHHITRRRAAQHLTQTTSHPRHTCRCTHTPTDLALWQNAVRAVDEASSPRTKSTGLVSSHGDTIVPPRTHSSGRASTRRLHTAQRPQADAWIDGWM